MRDLGLPAPAWGLGPCKISCRSAESRHAKATLHSTASESQSWQGVPPPGVERKGCALSERHTTSRAQEHDNKEARFPQGPLQQPQSIRGGERFRAAFDSIRKQMTAAHLRRFRAVLSLCLFGSGAADTNSYANDCMGLSRYRRQPCTTEDTSRVVQGRQHQKHSMFEAVLLQQLL